MSEHTPTPWRVYTNKDGTKLVGIGALDGGGILDAGFGVWSWNDPEGIANAHMVVKAVNNHERLVEALKLQEKADKFHMECEECDGEEAPEICEECFPLYDDARVARRAILADLIAEKTK